MDKEAFFGCFLKLLFELLKEAPLLQWWVVLTSLWLRLFLFSSQRFAVDISCKTLGSCNCVQEKNRDVTSVLWGFLLFFCTMLEGISTGLCLQLHGDHPQSWFKGMDESSELKFTFLLSLLLLFSEICGLFCSRVESEGSCPSGCGAELFLDCVCSFTPSALTLPLWALLISLVHQFSH